MKITLTNKKEVTVLEGYGTINVNDFMHHRLIVYCNPSLLPSETLWVSFMHGGATSNESILIKEYKDNEEYYVMTLPPAVTSVNGEWKFQLFVKRQRAVVVDGVVQYEYQEVCSSSPEPFTVSDGISESVGKAITNETAAALYEKAEEIVEIGNAIPKITTDDEGKFLRVVDGKWQASYVPNAENESF